MQSITAGKVWQQGHMIAYLHCSDQEGEFEQEVEPIYNLQGPTLRDSLPSARPHLPKIPQFL